MCKTDKKHNADDNCNSWLHLIITPPPFQEAGIASCAGKLDHMTRSKVSIIEHNDHEQGAY